MKIIKLGFAFALFSAPFLPLHASSASETNPNNAQVQNVNQKDGELIAFLIVLNQNEIAAAKEAKKKNLNKEVKSYANLMSKEHNKNLEDTLKVKKKIKQEPVSTPLVDSLKRKGEEELTVLTPLNSNQFDKAYIDAMVKGHEEAIMIIDTNFQNTVTNPALKKHLENTRSHIAAHLEKAKEIQTKMTSQ